MDSTKINKNKPKVFHIWDFPETVYLLIRGGERKKYFESIYSYYGGKRKAAKALGIDLGTIRNYERAFSIKYERRHPQYMPTLFFKKTLALFNKEFLDNLEKGVVAISTRNGLDIKNPILPIKESPEIYRIIAHIIADGSASKGKTPYYANNVILLRRRFIADLKVFGDLEIKERSVGGTTGVYFPKVVTDILAHLFNIRFTYPNRIPNQLFSASDKCKSVFLRALFDDEGSVTHSVVIGIHNACLLNQLKEILNSFGIGTTKITKTPYSIKKGIKYKMTFQIRRGSLRDFQNNVGFGCPIKSKKLRKFIKNRKVYP